MTPQEKGDKLIEIFWNEIHNTHLSDWLIMQKAIRCSIKAVEEIIKELSGYGFISTDSQTEYWNDVLNYLKSKL